MEAVPEARDIEALLAESEWIGALARSLLGDSHRAEDLAQEVRLAALRRPPQEGGSRKPWLATVARNAARMLHRSEGTRVARETGRAREDADGRASSPEELLANLETQELVSRLVRELPTELSDVILLAFFEGHSSEYIARLREIPAGTVRWRKKRALEMLRERLDSHHDGDRHAWMSALVPLTAPGWQSGVKAATSSGILAGLLAPWIAMSLTWKLIALTAAAVLLSLPFFADEEPGLTADDPLPLEIDSAAVALEVPTRIEEERPELEPEKLDQRIAVVQPAEQTSQAGETPVTRVRLRVIDSRGRAVADAEVRPSPSLAMQAAHENLLEELGPLRIAALQTELVRRTDAEGVAVWETDLLREDGLVDFLVTGPRFGTGEISTVLEVGTAVDLGDVTLASGGAVEGTVRGADGEPLARLIVALGPAQLLEDGSAPPSLDSWGLLDWDLGTARTDPRGRYHLDGVAPGDYRAYTKIGMNGEVAWSEPFAVQAEGLTDHIDLRCEVVTEKVAPARILVLGADGEPLLTAWTTLKGNSYSRSGGVDKNGTTDFGQYSQVAGGSLEVSDQSFVHRTTVIDPLPLTVESIVVQLELATIQERRLSLKDREGRPIKEASVKVTAPGRKRLWEPEGGEVSLILPAEEGERFNLFVEARGYLPLALWDLSLDGLPEEWSLMLEGLPGIRGVVLADGEPLKGAKLAVHPRIPATKVYVKGNDVSRMSSKALDEARSDPEGEFVLYASEDGALVVTASARGHADVAIELGGYVASGTREDLVIELKPTGSLRGTVFDHLGQPASRAYLVLDHPFHKLLRTRSGKDGTFRFRRVPEGDWVLRAVAEFEDGFFGTHVEVPEDYEFPANCAVIAGQETQHDLRLVDPAATWLRGRWSVSGADAGQFTAEISNLNGGMFGGDPFADSWERSTPLEPGAEFELSLPPDQDASFEITAAGMPGVLRRDIPANELPLELEVKLELATVTLRTPNWTMAGDGSETVYLEWSREGWTMFLSLRPDSEGGFPPAIVPAGEWNLLWSTPGSEETSSMQVELRVGEEREVLLP